MVLVTGVSSRPITAAIAARTGRPAGSEISPTRFAPSSRFATGNNRSISQKPSPASRIMIPVIHSECIWT